MNDPSSTGDLPVTTVERPDDPAEGLRRLWGQGQKPDVDAYLAQAGPLSAEQLAAVLRADQRERWQTGERVPAEAYLERYPNLGPEAALDLIYHEYLLRERGGQRPRLDDYC